MFTLSRTCHAELISASIKMDHLDPEINSG